MTRPRTLLAEAGAEVARRGSLSTPLDRWELLHGLRQLIEDTSAAPPCAHLRCHLQAASMAIGDAEREEWDELQKHNADTEAGL